MLIRSWNQEMQHSLRIFFHTKISCEARLQKRSFDAITSESQIKSNGELKKDEELRRSKRMRISKSFWLDFLTYLLENELQTFKKVMSSPETPYWKEAVMKLSLLCITILRSWLIFHLEVNHLVANGFSN